MWKTSHSINWTHIQVQKPKTGLLLLPLSMHVLQGYNPDWGMYRDEPK